MDHATAQSAKTPHTVAEPRIQALAQTRVCHTSISKCGKTHAERVRRDFARVDFRAVDFLAAAVLVTRRTDFFFVAALFAAGFAADGEAFSFGSRLLFHTRLRPFVISSIVR